MFDIENGEFKILQIAPITGYRLYSVGEDKDGQFRIPIIGMALVENKKGERDVYLLDVCNGGELGVASCNIDWEPNHDEI